MLLPIFYDARKRKNGIFNEVMFIDNFMPDLLGLYPEKKHIYLCSMTIFSINMVWIETWEAYLFL